jgi:hypothetical protein
VKFDRSSELYRIRAIGWRKWDPIGLIPPGESWESYPGFADEYDVYLLKSVSMLREGWSVTNVAEFLLYICTEHMELSHPNAEMLSRAKATAEALRSYVDELKHQS